MNCLHALRSCSLLSPGLNLRCLHAVQRPGTGHLCISSEIFVNQAIFRRVRGWGTARILTQRDSVLYTRSRTTWRRAYLPTSSQNMDEGVVALNEFLATARRLSQQADGTALTVVLGNEAADLDSMVCAIMYAFLLSQRAAVDLPPSVPVINIPRQDLSLRPDAVWILQQVGVDLQSLVFLDDLDLSALLASGRLHSLVLVDHNRLAARQAELEPAVVEILDHHADEGMYNSSKRTITTVGSCASLVATAWRSLPEAMALLISSAGLKRLLRGVILLDTCNFDPSQGRGTPLDEQVIKEMVAAEPHNSEDLYEELRFRRFDISAMSTPDVLRKDYKQWGMGPESAQVGIASIGMSLIELSARNESLEAATSAWAKTCELDLLILMGSFYPAPEEFCRQLLIIPCKESMQNVLPRLVAFLNDKGVALKDLKLRQLPQGSVAYLHVDNSYSRKRLQPIVDSFFHAGF